MDITELEVFYLQQHLDGMDRSAIRKELATKDLSEEDQKTILTYIDNQILYKGARSQKTINISTTALYASAATILIATVVVLSFVRSEGKYVVLPGVLPMFFILRALKKKRVTRDRFGRARH